MEHNLQYIQAWIKKIVDSCENSLHFDGAQVVINKYKEICNQEDRTLDVQDYLNRKFNERHGIIK